MAELHLPTFRLDRATRRPTRSGQHAEELVLPLPFKRDQTKHLAVMKIERNILELGPNPKVPDTQFRASFGRFTRGLALTSRDGMQFLFDRGTEHQVDDPLLRAGAHQHDADRLAVAENCGSIAEGGDF